MGGFFFFLGWKCSRKMQPCFIVCEVTVPTAGRKLLSAQPQAAASPDLSLDHHVVFVRLVDRVIVTWDHEEKAKLKVKLSAFYLECVRRMCLVVLQLL